MTEQNATVSYLQLWLLPQLQLHSYIATFARHPPQLSPRCITALSFKLLLRLPYGCHHAKQN